MPEPELLFVYGLLRRGMSAGLDAFVPGMATYRGPASVAGQLYSVGGRYPALVVSEHPGSQLVRGELWTITDPFAWPIIDDFEGIGPDYAAPQLYLRVAVNADTDDGKTVRAQAYAYNRSVADLDPVDSGDWANR